MHIPVLAPERSPDSDFASIASHSISVRPGRSAPAKTIPVHVPCFHAIGLPSRLASGQADAVPRSGFTGARFGALSGACTEKDPGLDEANLHGSFTLVAVLRKARMSLVALACCDSGPIRAEASRERRSKFPIDSVR